MGLCNLFKTIVDFIFPGGIVKETLRKLSEIEVTTPPCLAEVKMTYNIASATTGQIGSPTIDWATITHTIAPAFTSTSTSITAPLAHQTPVLEPNVFILMFIFGCLFLISAFIAYNIRHNRNETFARATQDQKLDWERTLNRRARRAVMKHMRKLQKQVEASRVLAQGNRQSLRRKCHGLSDCQSQLQKDFDAIRRAKDKIVQRLLKNEKQSKKEREANKFAISQADTKAQDLSRAFQKLQSDYANMSKSNQIMIEKLDTKAGKLEELEKAQGKTALLLDEANKKLITLQKSANDNVDEKVAMQKQIEELQTSVNVTIDEKVTLQEQTAKLETDLHTADAALKDVSTKLEFAKKFRENQRQINQNFKNNFDATEINLQAVQEGLQSWADAQAEFVEPAVASLEEFTLAQKAYNETTSKTLDGLSNDFHCHSSNIELAISAYQQTQADQGMRIEDIDKAQKLDHQDMVCRAEGIDNKLNQSVERIESRLALNTTAVDNLKQVAATEDVKVTKLNESVAVLMLSLADVGNLKQAVQANETKVLELDQTIADAARSIPEVVLQKGPSQCDDSKADFSDQSPVSGSCAPQVVSPTRNLCTNSQLPSLAAQQGVGGSQIFGTKSKRNRRGRKYHKIHHNACPDQTPSAFDAAMQKNKTSAKVTTVLLKTILPLSPAIVRIAKNKLRSSYSASIVLIGVQVTCDLQLLNLLHVQVVPRCFPSSKIELSLQILVSDMAKKSATRTPSPAQIKKVASSVESNGSSLSSEGSPSALHQGLGTCHKSTAKKPLATSRWASKDEKYDAGESPAVSKKSAPIYKPLTKEQYLELDHKQRRAHNKARKNAEAKKVADAQMVTEASNSVAHERVGHVEPVVNDFIERKEGSCTEQAAEAGKTAPCVPIGCIRPTVNKSIGRKEGKSIQLMQRSGMSPSDQRGTGARQLQQSKFAHAHNVNGWNTQNYAPPVSAAYQNTFATPQIARTYGYNGYQASYFPQQQPQWPMVSYDSTPQMPAYMPAYKPAPNTTFGMQQYSSGPTHPFSPPPVTQQCAYNAHSLDNAYATPTENGPANSTPGAAFTNGTVTYPPLPASMYKHPLAHLNPPTEPASMRPQQYGGTGKVVASKWAPQPHRKDSQETNKFQGLHKPDSYRAKRKTEPAIQFGTDAPNDAATSSEVGAGVPVSDVAAASDVGAAGPVNDAAAASDVAVSGPVIDTAASEASETPPTSSIHVSKYAH